MWNDRDDYPREAWPSFLALPIPASTSSGHYNKPGAAMYGKVLGYPRWRLP